MVVRHPQWHQVNAVGPEGAAAQQPPSRERESPPKTVLGVGLGGVVEQLDRSGRAIPVLNWPLGTPAAPARPLGPTGPASWPALCPGSGWLSCVHLCGLSSLAGRLQGPGHAGPELARVDAGRGGGHPQQVGAARQLGGHGASGFPHAPAQGVPHHRAATVLANCVSHLGKDTIIGRVGRHECGADGTMAGPSPRALQLGEGSAGSNPSDRPGRHSSSDGELVATLETPRLQNGPAGPRGHALAETVGLGPLACIGLVGALHVIQPFEAPWSTAISRGRCRVRTPAWSLGPLACGSGVPSMLGPNRLSPLVGRRGTMYLQRITAPRNVRTTPGRRGRRRGEATER